MGGGEGREETGRGGGTKLNIDDVFKISDGQHPSPVRFGMHTLTLLCFDLVLPVILETIFGNFFLT